MNTPSQQQAPSGRKAWSSRSVAGRFQHNFFYMLIRLGGRAPAYGFLRIVTLWYVLFRPSVRRRGYHYLNRRFPGLGGFQRLRHCFRHFVNLGESLVDRAAVGIIGPGSKKAVFATGRDALLELVHSGRGFILMGAHVGCWQAAMANIDFLERPVNMLLRRDTADLDRHWYEHQGGESPFRIIDPTGYLGGALEMLGALKRGEILCVMGDRELESGEQRNVDRVPFLGQEANFPVSPYALASASGAPIAVLFSYKAANGEHVMECPVIMEVPPRSELTSERGPRLWRPWLETYVRCLEEYCRAHPLSIFQLL